jgi:hypothetical protein
MALCCTTPTSQAVSVRGTGVESANSRETGTHNVGIGLQVGQSRSTMHKQRRSLATSGQDVHRLFSGWQCYPYILCLFS